MKRYERYKPSGIEWIGEIPDHWEVRKLKYVGQVQLSGVDKKNEPEERKVLLCNYIDVYKNEFIDDSLSFMEASATKNEIERFALNRGDVLITKDSETPDDIANPAFVRVERVEIICGYHLAHIRTNRDIMIGEYLFRLFQSPDFNAKFTVNAHGITRYGLSIDDIKSTKVLLPTVNEQTGISNYLDRKTAQIDELIAKKQRLIDLLNEEKTAIINQAVTKGLNPDTPMKDSGIPWLGKMPAHWEAIRLKWISKINPSKGASEFNKDSNDLVTFLPMEKVFEDGSFDNSTKKGISELWNGFTYFEEGDVIVAKITPCFENGKGALLENLGSKIGFGSTEFHVLRTSDKALPKFLFYLTRTKPFKNLGEALMYGAAGQKRVPTSFLEEFVLGLPPIEEQQKIVDYIDKGKLSIENTVLKIQREIELLQEYRTVLISEAVTGKIDVRRVN